MMPLLVPKLHMRVQHLPLLLILLSLVPQQSSLLAQDRAKDKSEPSSFDQLPFDEWLKQGPIQPLHCKLHITNSGLSIHQRLRAHIEAEMDGAELEKRGLKGRITALIQLTDASGKTYRDEGKLELGEMKPGTRKSNVLLSWDAFVIPDQYSVAVALYHTVTKEHSLILGRLIVLPLTPDPLPDAWRDLPAVEFWDPVRFPEPNALFRPDIEGKLHLPLATRRPVQIDVLADLTVTSLFGGSHEMYFRYLAVVVPILKDFSQIDLRNGTMNIATVDLERKQVTFQQDGVKDLDWPRLKKSIEGADPGTVSVQQLKTAHLAPLFLRDEVAKRIIPKSKEDPLHIVILITPPMSLYSFFGLEPVVAPAECNCRLYYLQDASSVGESRETDHLQSLFKGVPVKTFAIHNSRDVRDALAKILAEISQIGSAQ